MARVLVIGYGNPLRGDDAVGFRAAERLQELAGPEVEILAVRQLTPELAEPVSRADQVLFIDARAAGEAGTIGKRAVIAGPEAGGFTHHATPEGLLAMSAALFGRCPEAVLYTVAGQSFEFGAPLTAPVEEALESLLNAMLFLSGVY